MKWILATIVILVLGGSALAVYLSRGTPVTAPTVLVPAPEPYPKHSIIGHSVEGRTIDAYTYGTGTTTLGIVGGMHGGYEWNSVLLSYELMDYLAAHKEAIPANLSVTIVPDANPDAVFKVVGKEGRFATSSVPTGDLVAERFNAHSVDLNRNFDCHWQATSTFLGKATSAGTAAFSEPEAQAIRNFAITSKPKAMVFLHSKAGAVYASECDNGILPKTREVMTVYAKASGYRAIDVFDAYVIHGDSEGWLASIGIPAVTVELTTHNSVEYDKNLAGVKALIADMAVNF